MAHYNLFVPLQAVGVSLVYFDLFNASGSGVIVNVKSVIPVVSGAVGVTGAVAVDLFLTKTSTVGTTGTAAVNEGTSLTACTFTGHDTDSFRPGGVTARLTPGGGATAAGVLSWVSVFTEETSAATYSKVRDLVRQGYNSIPPVSLAGGQGIRVVQGSVASVGNIGFNVLLDIG